MALSPRQAVLLIRTVFPDWEDLQLALGVIATRLEAGDTFQRAVALGERAVRTRGPHRNPDELRIFAVLQRREGA